jgi:hypothetical protein
VTPAVKATARDALQHSHMAIRSPKWLVVAALVTLAPDTPGVFELWDGDELLYVGSTRRKETLRTELERELAAHAREATHFSWEITFDPDARSRELLAEFESEHHHPPRFNSRA